MVCEGRAGVGAGPLARRVSSGSRSWRAVPNRCPGLEARCCGTHPVRSPTHPAQASPCACVHMPPSWEGTGPGACCQLCPSSQKGTHWPLPLQDVLWELFQDPNWPALSVGLRGGPEPPAWPRAGTRNTCVTGRVQGVGPICASPASKSPQTLAHLRATVAADAPGVLPGTHVHPPACC